MEQQLPLYYLSHQPEQHFTGTVTAPIITSTGLITTGEGINFNNSTATNNAITGLFKMSFDQNYGGEKYYYIIMEMY